jgi:hypothetical protein
MIGFKFGDWWRDRKASDEIADLKTELAKTHDTVMVKEGLYVTEAVKTFKLQALLDTSRAEVASLARELDDMKAQLLTTTQISLGWKKAYEEALKAQQTEEPPTDPGGVPRKRVEFEGNLGPIRATGHTLTDPPEAFLKLEQVTPLLLTVSVAQNKDRTWSTFVTSSDPNVDVKVNLSGVNPLVISPKWYQRIWMDLGAAALGDPAGYLGLSWRGDRFSVGGMCYASGGSMNGCGATLGVRLFK